MNKQKSPYNQELSAHFINLALAAEAQCDWEIHEKNPDEVENPFKVPLDCYNKLLRANHMSGEAVKADVDGPTQEQYELVGSIRLGQHPVADYEEIDDAPNIVDAQDFGAVVELMTTYQRRVSETITNTVRYNISNLIMGFALRSKVDGHGVIVLRGTMTTDEWLNNMNYRMKPFLPADDLTYGQVHEGFRDIYKGLRGRYRELAAEIDPEKPLYLVGHSLGAAVSMIGALDIALKQPERAANIHAYLFAPPRTGDATFAQYYDELVGTSYRIVNVCDVVPYVPFEEMGTISDMLGYPYADTKGEVSFMHQMGNPIANHIGSYHMATRENLQIDIVDTTKPIWLGKLFSHNH